MANEHYRHIFLQDAAQSSSFTPPKVVPRVRIPERDRVQHSNYLQNRLTAAWNEAEQRRAVAIEERHGVYIDFVSDPDSDLAVKSLEVRRSGIRLLNVRHEPAEGKKERTCATVYVPNAKRGHFLKKITQYAEGETKSGKPKNEKLVNSIADIRRSVVESFWQDEKQLLPGDEPVWVEIWLSSDQEEIIHRFESLLQDYEITKSEGVLKFPERSVVLIEANRAQLETLVETSDDIAEIRRAKEVATVLIELENREQLERVRELLSRTKFEEDTEVAVCLLDTGVNYGHLLIDPVLFDADCHTVDPAWGTHDHDGHGTMMAGLAAYGDLLEALQSGLPLHVTHRLESAKILPPHPESNAPKLYGHVTAQGISRAEIQAPERKRFVCLAVTSTDFRDRGHPSSWSAELDHLASGADGTSKRLIVVSAGNVDNSEWRDYPDSNLTNEVHDPGQSWNALTVGAYTEKVTITDTTLRGYRPIANRGSLSPFSTTSLTWHRWPIKPEVVFEGGNVAVGPNNSILDCDDLALLSTCHEPTVAQFVPFGMTSAAAAQAAWMAARIQREYSEAWPETIRALIVHSAKWTDEMKAQFLPDESKSSYQRLLRICGYGVPNLEQALFCASNSLTLISQAELQPYDKADNRYVTRDMHLYGLPWPREALLELHDTEVQMRVTLSYFIEPGPGEVGWQDRYRYASFGLRFAVKSPGESQEEFVRRVNAKDREDGEVPGTSGPSDKWIIGEKTRNAGSIHSDIWSGTAADLATSNLIAVYPTIGWWRERHHLGKWNKDCRYSLVVSIHTPPETVDIYTPVAVQIGAVVPVQVRV